MNLLNLIGFGLKVWRLVLMLCCWCLPLISYTRLSNNGEVMSTKSGLFSDGGKIWMKLWKHISECFYKIHHHYSVHIGSRKNWWRKLLGAWIVFWILMAFGIFWCMSSQTVEKRKESLAGMCDERARMLNDQFNVSMNHIQAMSVLIATFHHGKNPSAIDQRTFASYTERTAFERPLTSGVAYAARVLHSEREQFEIQQGWTIKRMDSVEQNPVHKDEYNPADLEPSPVQEEYAPVIFAQDTVAHIISIDVLSGKEDSENVLRARESGKGVLTAPFRLLKTNRLGVILTFAVYKRDLPPYATSSERTEATAGYFGGIFDVESLVEKLLQQLASKQVILVNVYDTTNLSDPISMYGSNILNDGMHHVSALNFGDPFRKHEMHCRFKLKPPWPWGAITTSSGILVIALLIGQIFHATMNRIAKVEDDYHEMMELKKRAEAADVAKSQFLATVSHEIRTPMNGVLGMLHMLMDTDLDETQEDYVRTAQESGKALVSLINEVLDQAKIESGRLELEAVCFDLRAILDDVLSLFSGKSQEKGVELAVYVSDKVPAVLVGDPGRFRQIITNLMGNSIKFTEKGHIYVTVHLVEEAVNLMELEMESPSNSTLSGLPVADRWRSCAGFKAFSREESVPTYSSSSTDQVNLIVSVEDTGQGIPLEAQSRVFTPFMQVVPSITRTHGGTGIGLSISRCLVHLMKGEIGFASLPQIGSTFTFTAVFTRDCSNANDQKSQQINNQLKSISLEFREMRALLVDPRPTRAKVSVYHIERLGIRVEVVRDLDNGFFSINTGNSPPNVVFIEWEVWDKDLTLSTLFVNKLRSLNCAVTPKLFLLSGTISSTRAIVSSVFTPSVIMKPLRASLLTASLQHSMGVRNRVNHRNGELSTLSLRNLLRGRKILVVDDNLVNLRVATGALKKYGADVVHAERGKEAISLLTPPHHFDACFMDIQMPEMDGFEATQRIRDIESSINNRIRTGELSLEAYRNISTWHTPILAMTADVIQATNEECLKYEMDGYVSKPFEAEQLYREVSRFFQTASNENPRTDFLFDADDVTSTGPVPRGMLES
ncbi:histidine kinase 3-like [Olea europaea var. sylvestris]|uniref:histidine kinase 3-like n=1 Tax=Olea europaea var. sylvestris TaxID=158386 RepID=UPI000C1D2E38|nr:histidine kinase 3-like [Olea europaea var. sylvestris]